MIPQAGPVAQPDPYLAPNTLEAFMSTTELTYDYDSAVRFIQTDGDVCASRRD